MRRASWVAIAGTLVLGIGGCGGAPEGDPNAASPVPPDPAAVPAATGVPVAPAGVPVAAAPAGVPVPSPGLPPGTVPPELITSTNASERVQEVRRNRADPFSLIPVNPVVIQAPQTQTAPLVAPQGQGVRIPQLPSNTSGSRNTSGSSNTSGRSGGSQGNGRLAPIPTLVPNRSSTAAQRPFVAPPPQPDVARAVQVLGVVQIGNTAHAIVQAPNEPTSRYVQVGQRLSNGQVLVKRIEMNRGAEEPVVVLEQYGIEVPTAVGQGGSPVIALGQPAV